jgi:hypothetical protein
VKANFTDPRDQVASFVMAAAMPADDNLTITQSELDSVKAGTWDMAGSLSDTVDQSLAYLDSLPELNPTGSANEKPSTQKNMFIQVWPKF